MGHTLCFNRRLAPASVAPSDRSVPTWHVLCQKIRCWLAVNRTSSHKPRSNGTPTYAAHRQTVHMCYGSVRVVDPKHNSGCCSRFLHTCMCLLSAQGVSTPCQRATQGSSPAWSRHRQMPAHACGRPHARSARSPTGTMTCRPLPQILSAGLWTGWSLLRRCVLVWWEYSATVGAMCA